MLIARPDDETNVALRRLGRMAEWETIERWLKASREACIQQSLAPDDTVSRQNQGAYVVLGELTTLVQKAADGPRP